MPSRRSPSMLRRDSDSSSIFLYFLSNSASFLSSCRPPAFNSSLNLVISRAMSLLIAPASTRTSTAFSASAARTWYFSIFPAAVLHRPTRFSTLFIAWAISFPSWASPPDFFKESRNTRRCSSRRAFSFFFNGPYCLSNRIDDVSAYATPSASTIRFN